MINNLVKESANNPGTGTTISLLGAPSGYSSFVASFGAGAKCHYFITDGVQTEAQSGTVTAGAPNTLSRGTPLWTSNGGTARLNFTGAVTVYCALPAQRQPYFDDTNALQMGSRKILGLADGYDARDVPNMQQISWRNMGGQAIITPVAGVIMTLPDSSRFTFIRLDWRDMRPAVFGQLFMRYSTDFGVSFRGGAADYGFAATTSRTGSVTPSGGNASYVGLSDNIMTTGICNGSVQFPQASGMGLVGSAGITTGPVLSRWDSCFNAAFSGPITHVFVGFAGGNISNGLIRLCVGE